MPGTDKRLQPIRRRRRSWRRGNRRGAVAGMLAGFACTYAFPNDAAEDERVRRLFAETSQTTQTAPDQAQTHAEAEPAEELGTGSASA